LGKGGENILREKRRGLPEKEKKTKYRKGKSRR